MMQKLWNAKRAAQSFVRSEAGATAIEYALIAALIGIFIITSLQTLGTGLDAIFSQIAAFLAGIAV